jgi:aerobic carbon-monoxide dehydrogenase large subunit
MDFGGLRASSNSTKHISGMATFVDDIALPRMAYAGFVRSPLAHANIKRISSSKLEKDHLVLRTLWGDELAEMCKPIPSYLYSSGEIRLAKWNCLAVNRVNFVGEAVGAVVCEKRYMVEDAIETVDVEYDSLPPVLDPEKALDENSPLVHDYLGSNRAIRFGLKGGDANESFRSAAFTIERKFKMHRHSTVPMEPRAALANYEKGSGKLTLWASTQAPFILRSHISQLLGIPENKIRVIAPDVGGGFGAKLQISPEYIVVCVLSMLLSRPVKWTETRSENLSAFAHAREQVHKVEAAFGKDGEFLAIRDRAILSAGAYLDTRLSGQALLPLYELAGPYRLRAIDSEIDVVLTNKCPYGPYRGFGLETGVLVVERLMNIAARRLGLDPVEIRKRNLIKQSEMPYKTVTGLVYDPVDFEGIMTKALRIADYEQFRKSRRNYGAKDGTKFLGIGLSVVIEPSSTNAFTGVVEPGEINASTDFGGARVTMDPGGRVCVFLGTPSIGTDHEDAVGAVVAEQLGIFPTDVTVTEGDTESTPYDSGVRASRFSAVVIPAVFEATRRVRSKLTRAAASMLEANELDLEFTSRRIHVKGSSAPSLRIEEVAKAFYALTDKLPPGLDPSLDETYYFKPEKKKGLFNSFTHAAHVPIIEFDSETGKCAFVKYVVVEDCGKVIIRETVDGQIYGGLAQVIGGMFYEEAKYDEDGQLVSGTFTDYLIPSAVETFSSLDIDHTTTPSLYPGGAKGMGESSNVCGYAAILNAVDDAFSEFGKEVNITLLSPENVWRSVRSTEQSIFS